MEKNTSNQTLALAALMQSALLVSQLARKGMADTLPMQTLLGSILKTEADSIDDVYAGIGGLESGLRQIVSHLSQQSRTRDMDITRYVIGLLALEKKLSRQPEMLQAISRGIGEAGRQHEHFGLMHENMMAKLADIYSSTLSTLSPRIMVSGEPQLLANPDNANRIRALLLAGIRAAVLWRQAGGSRWKLLLQRKRFVNEAEQRLQSIQQ